MNWPVLILFGMAAVVLIIFLVWRNQKDKRELENKLNNDYHKAKEEEGDIDIEEITK